MSFMDDDAHDGHGENHKQAEEKQVDTDFFNAFDDDFDDQDMQAPTAVAPK